MSLFFLLKKGMNHQQWRQKESKPTPLPQKKKKKLEKKSQIERKRETRYLNQLVFNKKIYSLYCFLKHLSTFRGVEAAVHPGVKRP